MTLAALVQAASAEPTRIYGLWKPRWDWGVFGPYVSRNHFAGYLAMAIPVAVGFAAESALHVRRSWGHRRFGWVALGDPAGIATLRRGAAAMVLMVGLLASHSRGGLLAFGAASLALVALLRRWRALLLPLVAAVVVIGLFWVDVGATRTAFETRGLQQSRLALWDDAIAHVPAVSRPRRRLQRVRDVVHAVPDHRALRVVRRGAQRVPAGAARPGDRGRGCWWRRCWCGCCGPECGPRRRRRSTRACWEPSSPAASTTSVDFNWQIPANAATFAALAGVIMRQAASLHRGGDLDRAGAAA